jgi:hypothetical protein
MAKDKPMVLFVGAYDDVAPALQDLGAIEQLHDAELIGDYDAAVVDIEDGKPHIVKRVDRPRIHAIPELFGGGPLPRSEVKDAAKQLSAGEAGLVVVGEPTIETGLEKAVTRATKVVKRDFEETADAVSSALVDAFKS